jgi:TonB family protein
MDHGILGFFAERSRSQRRVSILCLTVALTLFVLLLGARTPKVRESIDRVVRFGYEGPDQYVRRITLLQYRGTGGELTDLGPVEPRAAQRGGSLAKRSTGREGRPETRPRLEGPGDATRDLMVGNLRRLPDVPVVQSEDLVIAHLVRPRYPAEAREQGIEGKVAIQALIDTTGRVVEVQLMSSTGEPMFEQASQEAVWQCRFHPYHLGGRAREVYAIFRFSFRIY